MADMPLGKFALFTSAITKRLFVYRGAPVTGSGSGLTFLFRRLITSSVTVTVWAVWKSTTFCPAGSAFLKRSV